MIVLSQINNGTRERIPLPSFRFQKHFDVIVCGLGTSGSFAALFSAENGLSVLGIETFSCVGGTNTVGGIPGEYFGTPGGICEKTEKEIRGFAQKFTATRAESRKFLLEQKLKKEGVTLCYESSVCGVFLNENAIVGLRVLTPDGIFDYSAEIVMDCTADAYVASIAGCPMEQGRVLDGQMQPYSLVSMVFNGQKYRYTNLDFGRTDPHRQSDFSKAILFSRSYQMAEAKRNNTLIAQMPFIGLREGRRIVAEEGLSLEDIFADQKTACPMFYSYADLDKHGWDLAFDGEGLGDWAVGANLGAYNITVPVPYKALLPKGYDGILVPCRALGVDRDLSSCVRMNRDMKKAAEAASLWATLAIKQNRRLRDVSYAELREKLLESGCLNENHDRGVRVDGKKNWDGTPLTPRDVFWICEPEKLSDLLKTETPGEAIWSAKRMGKDAVPILRNLLDSSDENTRKHAAFALAILGNGEGIPLLRKMVRERDGVMLKDCRKHNQMRGWMAIYWLGRLGDEEIVCDLVDLICDPDEIQKEVYGQKGVQTTRYKILDFQGIYFQFVSHAVMALIRIGESRPHLQEEIRKGFSKAFSTEDFSRRITKRPEESSEGNAVQTIKNVAFDAAERWEKNK